MAESVAYLFALASAATFLLGFSPPRALRLSWRQQEDRALQTATAALLRSNTVEQIATNLLAPTMRIMGASGAAIVNPEGTVVASHGDAPPPGSPLTDRLDTPDEPARESPTLGQAGRTLVIWTSAYTPFFGPEELGLFRSMAAVGGLAFDRAALLGEERQQRLAIDRPTEPPRRHARPSVLADLPHAFEPVVLEQFD